MGYELLSSELWALSFWAYAHELMSLWTEELMGYEQKVKKVQKVFMMPWCDDVMIDWLTFFYLSWSVGIGFIQLFQNHSVFNILFTFSTLGPSDTQIRQETAKAQPWANHVEPTGFTNDCHKKVVCATSVSGFRHQLDFVKLLLV